MNISAVLLVLISVTTTTYAITGLYQAIMANLKKVPAGKPAYQSSLYTNNSKFAASKAVDGNTNTNMDTGSCFHTETNRTNWWYVDLQQTYRQIRKIELYSRTDCCAERNKMISVQIGTSLDNMRQVKYWSSQIGGHEKITFTHDQVARYVKLVHTANTYFHMCELEVYHQ
ncbi:fucolectin-6-like [Mercenaria mercenaria]|uniref:fucolectin-6-like n=1 Tax=Mercenaria mercenaria TaxID=6596 RepID=UPI00234ED7F9|nr:fucolectin-6-like [Mercenaria mercenaria]